MGLLGLLYTLLLSGTFGAYVAYKIYTLTSEKAGNLSRAAHLVRGSSVCIALLSLLVTAAILDHAHRMVLRLILPNYVFEKNGSIKVRGLATHGRKLRVQITPAIETLADSDTETASDTVTLRSAAAAEKRLERAGRHGWRR